MKLSLWVLYVWPEININKIFLFYSAAFGNSEFNCAGVVEKDAFTACAVQLRNFPECCLLLLALLDRRLMTETPTFLLIPLNNSENSEQGFIEELSMWVALRLVHWQKNNNNKKKHMCTYRRVELLQK